MPKKDKPSPKKRKGDYAKKVSGEIIEQIKRGTAPWQKPWKPGRFNTRRILQPGSGTREGTACI